MTIETKTITAGDTFTDAITIDSKEFTISVRGLNNSYSVVSLMRKRVGDTDYRLVEKFTDDVEANYNSIGEWQYILGCEEGNYKGSTTVLVEIEG